MERDHFLTDVFERIIHEMRGGNRRSPPTGDPAKLFDKAVESVIKTEAEILREEAAREKANILAMAEEFKERNKDKRPGQQHDLVRTRWATSNYDRRR